MKYYSNYAPNHIPRGTRVANLLFSALLLAYGSYGVYIDDLFIPGKRTRGVHMHGEPAWLLYAGMVFAALNMLSLIVDHYDRRDNEWNYRRIAKLTQWAAWTFFVLAFVLDLFVFHKGTRT